jgi:hypothetical protein
VRYRRQALAAAYRARAEAIAVRTLEEYITDELAAGQLPDFEVLPKVQDGEVLFSIAPRHSVGEVAYFKVIGNCLVSLGSRSHCYSVPRGTLDSQ